MPEHRPCRDHEDVVVELALGVADAQASAEALAHLERCPECRGQLTTLSEAADRLVLLAPPAEPPAGFDARVVAGLDFRAPPGAGDAAGAKARAAGRWRRVVLAVAAAVSVAALATSGWLLATRLGGRPRPAVPSGLLTAALEHGGHHVGQVMVERGRRPWLSVAVVAGPARAAVRCEVVGTGGTTATLGTFPIRDGYGYWAAPLPGASGVRALRLVAADGSTVATAVLGWEAPGTQGG